MALLNHLAEPDNGSTARQNQAQNINQIQPCNHGPAIYNATESKLDMVMVPVFISYVRENRAIVERLCDELRRHGIEVWLDRDRNQPWQRWSPTILQAIAHGAFVLACFSKEYTGHDPTRDINKELSLAIHELHKHPTNRTWFIPVLLSDSCLPDISIGRGKTLRGLQSVSLCENWEKGVHRIVSMMEVRSRVKHLEHLTLFWGPFLLAIVGYSFLPLLHHAEHIRIAASLLPEIASLSPIIFCSLAFISLSLSIHAVIPKHFGRPSDSLRIHFPDSFLYELESARVYLANGDMSSEEDDLLRL